LADIYEPDFVHHIVHGSTFSRLKCRSLGTANGGLVTFCKGNATAIWVSYWDYVFWNSNCNFFQRTLCFGICVNM